jgi:hypothetical protein
LVIDTGNNSPSSVIIPRGTLFSSENNTINFI